MQNSCIIILLLFANISCAHDKPLGQIPFTVNSNGHIIIALKINGQSVSDFVLDTGASVTVLSESMASQLNLSLQDGVFQSIGVNGIVNDRRKTQGQRISLNDNITLEDLEMTVVDLSHLGGINGLIGFDLFRAYVTETNFDSKIISFYKRKGKPNTKGYQSISFVESYCTPEIEVSALLSNNESFSGKVFFDTGAASTPLTFNSPFVNKYNLASKFKNLITSESRGINSVSENHEGMAESIEIGNYELSNIPITLSSAKQGMLSKESYMGNLGLEYIRRFNFILDYNRKKIYLKANKSYGDAFDFPLSGVSLITKDSGIFIKHVSEPSMAYDKGLRAGQQLISIDGEEGRDVLFYKEALKKENKRIIIVVKLDDNTLKTVEILLTRLI